MALVVKAHLSKDDGSVETRRFSISQELTAKAGVFELVNKKIGNVFSDLENKCYSLLWKDSDEDFVIMSTDEEIQDAIGIMENPSLHIYIRIDGERTVNMIKLTEANQSQMENVSPKGKEQEKEKEKGTNQEEWYSFPPFGIPHHFMGPPPPPPPPPPPFPFHHGPFFGPHGHMMHRDMKHHFGGRDHPFGHPYGHGHHGHGHHGHGHHGHGHHGHGHRGHGHHGHGHHGHGHHHPYHGGVDGVRHCKKKGAEWKAELRNAVPVQHRRWAKAFIQKWRQENLTNATTTSSETDNGFDDELTMTKAGVPLSYKKWLNRKLPRWHRKWGAYKVNSKRSEASDIDEVSKEEKKLMKASVPKEFRQWTKWYLQRHFGQRVAPKFKADVYKRSCCPQENGDEAVTCKRNGQGQYKRLMLASLVPASHRQWTKKFIHEWRVQKKLDSPSAAITSMSGSDDTDLDQDEVAVPQDYGKWLEVFLLRWHRMRGLIEKADGQENNGVKGRFKDSVPMDYRAWVKFYMVLQYGRQRGDRQSGDTMMAKHKAWLQVFQKKWLKEQQAVGDDSEDFTVLTSGDEGDSAQILQADETGESPEKSFKRLRLSDDEEMTQQRSVHFDQSSYEPIGESIKQKKMMASDSEEEMEGRKSPRKMPVNHRFRKWVWQELGNWDGQSTTDSPTDEFEEGADIPPHVYQWMSKVMNKLQIKNMKQQLKVAKKEIKASQKLAKAEKKAMRRGASFD